MLKYNTVCFVFLSGYAVLKWFLLKFVFIARLNFPIFGFIYLFIWIFYPIKLSIINAMLDIEI